MSSLDHVDIIGSISNGKGYFIQPFSYCPYNFCFLNRGNSAADNTLTFLGDLDEFLFNVLVLFGKNDLQAVTLNKKALPYLAFLELLESSP